MASLSQPPFFSSLVPIKKNKNLALSSRPNTFLSLRNSKISSSDAESFPNFEQNSPETQPGEEDTVKLSFAKAKAYKKSLQSCIPTPKIVQNPLKEPHAEGGGKNDDALISDELGDGDVNKEIPLAVKFALEKEKEYKISESAEADEGAVSKIVQNSGGESSEMEEEKDGLKPDEGVDDGGQKEVPLAVKLALERAQEYKKNKGDLVSSGGGVGGSETLASGLQGGNEKIPADEQSFKNIGKKEELSISSSDFMGLDFSDKKTGRGLPAGLVPQSDLFPEGELPEVEILVGDTSKFGDAAVASSKAIPSKEDAPDLYKPKVSTWGVFTRPSNISKTYGGGRNIRPGEALESAEEKSIKEARTRQLLAAYKSKTGLYIDPKLKSECEKALNDGDSLMDLGKLKEALPFYEKVMEKLAFQSELHGLAALQWSICQDSLSRPNEAHVMYEKLKSHPSPQVSKKARQFFFGFQAMEMMKVSSSSPRFSTGYQNYFEAFLPDKTNYPLKEAEVDGGGLNQSLPYVFLLVSPIFIVLLIAASKIQ